QLELAQPGDELRDLRAEARIEIGHLEADDLGLLLRSGEVDEEVQAAAQQRLRQLARAVRGEYDDGPMPRRQRAELGHAHLEVAQHLEQERLELRIALV